MLRLLIHLNLGLLSPRWTGSTCGEAAANKTVKSSKRCINRRGGEGLDETHTRSGAGRAPAWRDGAHQCEISQRLREADESEREKNAARWHQTPNLMEDGSFVSHSLLLPAICVNIKTFHCLKNPKRLISLRENNAEKRPFVQYWNYMNYI